MRTIIARVNIKMVGFPGVDNPKWTNRMVVGTEEGEILEIIAPDDEKIVESICETLDILNLLDYIGQIMEGPHGE